MTDSEIIKEFNNGDKKQAFEKLYKTYVQYVYRFAYSRTGNKDISEEIAADTFFTLYEVLPNYRGDGKLSSFIIGIAFNKLREYWKLNKRRKKLVSLEEFLQEDNQSDPASLFLLDESGEKNNSGELVGKVLEELKENYRKVLVLKFIKGKNNREISKEMRITLDNVRQIQKRALLKAAEIGNNLMKRKTIKKNEK